MQYKMLLSRIEIKFKSNKAQKKFQIMSQGKKFLWGIDSNSCRGWKFPSAICKVKTQESWWYNSSHSQRYNQEDNSVNSSPCAGEEQSLSSTRESGSKGDVFLFCCLFCFIQAINKLYDDNPFSRVPYDLWNTWIQVLVSCGSTLIDPSGNNV
jgi:hypothetical protein